MRLSQGKLLSWEVARALGGCHQSLTSLLAVFDNYIEPDLLLLRTFGEILCTRWLWQRDIRHKSKGHDNEPVSAKMQVFCTFLKNETRDARKILTDVQTDIAYKTDTCLINSLAHYGFHDGWCGLFFYHCLQGNECVAFLSWPYELTYAKTFFLSF